MTQLMIRKAKESDLQDVNRLLHQVLEVHAQGRPDIFKTGTKKYKDDELLKIFQNPLTPVFVAVEDQHLLGYCFCIYQKQEETENMQAMNTLYIDDLCVDEKCRGKHIGTALYQYVLDYAKKNRFYNVTLNVWALNENAFQFYQKMGLVPLKTTMEKIL